MQTVTPMMKQYLDIKSQYQDAILFYRMGDFYEMFFEDAIIAANCLNIALTKRGKHETQDIPMCGVPFHSSESYLSKLISEGYKVAICEQTETPQEAKKRGYNSVVRREVVRLMTPGTLFEDNLLNAKSSNYLVAIASFGDELALSWVDISTCEFSISETSVMSLNADLARINPTEIIISEILFKREDVKKIMQDWKKITCSYVKSFFELAKCERNILDFYKIASTEVIGNLTKAQISAGGAILQYLLITQKNNRPKLSFPKIPHNNHFMHIDNTTRCSLELVSSNSREKKFSLLGVLDNTSTNMGGRLLFKYISSPLMDYEVINKRLNLVEFFFHNQEITTETIEHLKLITDTERAVTRINLNSAGPRDLNLLKQGLFNTRKLASMLLNYSNKLPPVIERMISKFSMFDEIIAELNNALADELPLLARDGGFVNPSFHPKLEDLHNLNKNSKDRINDLKQKYIDQTKIASLKIVHNNILGYFIEISPQHVTKMNNEKFILRQTLSSAVRFTTNELRILEEEIVNAKDLILKIEIEIFEDLCRQIIAISDDILFAAQHVAFIDVIVNFAYVARKNNYVRPIVDDSCNFNVIGGRHPVVESVLSKNADSFIQNDCNLSDPKNIWLLTGPNMAGKSTFLRQNAIIAIMAQIGSFVPAKKAYIGVVDKVFSRVGASDDLAKGRSTFMVEMLETATILNQATSRSLVILDEIGRGTSTYDGLSIAWSCLEYIHNVIRARTIFATHYHELSQLEKQLSNLVCYNMAVKEWENNIIFMHQVQEGAADKSYGVHVAKIAGVPIEVIARANQLLNIFEASNKSSDFKNMSIEELGKNNIEKQDESEIIKILSDVNINNITPFEAMQILASLKSLLS